MSASLCLVHLSVINAPIFGGLFSLRIPGSRLNDRQLDVLAIEQMSLPRLAFTLFMVLFGRSHPGKGVRVFQFRRMEAHVDRPLPVTVDGELACSLSGDFELAAQAPRVITPHARRPTPALQLPDMGCAKGERRRPFSYQSDRLSAPQYLLVSIDIYRSLL